MSYIVNRIPEQVRIDPDAGGKERRPKREMPGRKQDGGDSVTISGEARRRSGGEAAGPGEGAA